MTRSQGAARKAPIRPGPHGHEMEVLEKDTDTSWALFQALQNQQGRGFEKTEPAVLHAPASQPGPSTAPTLDDLLVEVRRNNRVCPRPVIWQRLYDFLPNKGPQLSGVPGTRAEWDQMPALQKRSRLREHIEWAAMHGVLQQVYDALKALPEERWYHMGE